MIGKIKNNLLRKALTDGAVKKVILSQYESTMIMMREAIAQCDDDLWLSKDYKNNFWHVCYHSLFYADLYLSEDEYTFTPWSLHKKEYQFLGTVPYSPYHKPQTDEPYSKPEILEYHKLIFDSLEERIAKKNLDDTSGFFWLPFNKLELQFYNIRHIQHHTAQLIERLHEEKNISIDWVGYGEKYE